MSGTDIAYAGKAGQESSEEESSEEESSEEEEEGGGSEGAAKASSDAVKVLRPMLSPCAICYHPMRYAITLCVLLSPFALFSPYAICFIPPFARPNAMSGTEIAYGASRRREGRRGGSG
eukprot:2814116-Rhodomonas_salina.2